MKSWLNSLWLFLRDERGEPMSTAMGILYGAGAMGAGSALGGIFGKKKGGKAIEPFPGYFGLGGDLSELIREKMKTQGTAYPGSFHFSQPGVEKAAQDTITGKLGQPPTVSGYSSDITAKHYAARKERLGERHEEEVRQAKDMYNRLGLVSSSPGIKGVSDIKRQHGLELDDISSQLMYEDIQREMDANKLVEDIMLAWTGQAQALGGAQRGYERYETGMNYQDWVRQLQEPYQWGQLGTSVLGGGTPRYQEGQMNAAGQLGMAGQDIGTMLMLKGILGGEGT